METTLIILNLILLIAILIISLINRNSKSEIDLDPKLLEQQEKIGKLAEQLDSILKESAALDAQKDSLKGEISQRDGTINTLANEIRDQQISLSERLSNVSGRLNFGEIELERSLELSGLSNNISYFLQAPIKDDNQEPIIDPNGRKMIPDATIILPDSRILYIDAKFPITALDTLREDSNSPDANKIFAQTFQKRINEVSNSGYHESGLNTPGFTVLFVPGDHFIMEAIKGNPHILQNAIEKNVVVATPGTLFTIIKTVELSFSREQFSKKVKDFEKQAREITVITLNFLKSLEAVGQRSNQLQKAYDDTIKKLSGSKGLLNSLKKISTTDLPDISSKD